MKQSIDRISTALFAASMIFFFILGFLIVFGQALGLIIQSGDIVSGAYSKFAQSSIALAVLASLCGYIAYNTVEEKPVLEEDEDYTLIARKVSLSQPSFIHLYRRGRT